MTFRKSFSSNFHEIAVLFRYSTFAAQACPGVFRVKKVGYVLLFIKVLDKQWRQLFTYETKSSQFANSAWRSRNNVILDKGCMKTVLPAGMGTRKVVFTCVK